MSKHFLQIQEQLNIYFKGTDNPTLVKFIEVFSFHKETKDEKINQLLEKFLADHQLTDIWETYISDFVKNESKYFAKTHGSDREMVNEMKHAMLIIAFNRFRSLDLAEPKLKSPHKIKFHGTRDIKRGTICIVDNFRGEYTLCGTLIEGDLSGKHSPTDDKTTCTQCLGVVAYCKNMNA